MVAASPLILGYDAMASCIELNWKCH